MNLRMLMFTGFMTALVGALLGIIVVHITERESHQKVAIIVGSTMGLAIGVGYEAMQQNRELE